MTITATRTPQALTKKKATWQAKADKFAELVAYEINIGLTVDQISDDLQISIDGIYKRLNRNGHTNLAKRFAHARYDERRKAWLERNAE